MRFPRVRTDDRLVNQLQDNIAKLLEPLSANPATQGLLLSSVKLATGANVINHTLNRTLRGWLLVRQRASAAIYDTQDVNTTPGVTLNLTSSAPVTVDIYVF